MEEEVKELLEKLNKKPLAMQYRDLMVIKEAYKKQKISSNLIDIAKGTYKPNRHHFEIVVQFDSENAVLKEVGPKPSFKEALFTIVFKGERTSTFYRDEDEAILGYLGLKNLGRNQGFSEFAYKMLK